MLCHVDEGVGPPLVFLHGFLGGKEDWLDLVCHLKDAFRCICIDLPGHGGSTYSPHLVQAVAACMQQLALPPCCMVGYSLGGRVALALARQFPSCARSLILLSTHPGLQTPRERSMRWERDVMWSQKLHSVPMDSFLRAWYNQPLFDSFRTHPRFEEVVQRRALQNPHLMAQVLTQLSLSKQPPYAPLPLPTLFLHGQRDGAYQSLCATLPSVQIPNAGHVLPIEAPQPCAQLIRIVAPL